MKTILAQETKTEAGARWEVIADALRAKQPWFGALMNAARDDGLAYMSFSRAHWTQIAYTTPLTWVDREVTRRTDIVGIFPNDEAIIVRLVGAFATGPNRPRPRGDLLETHDEQAVTRRYMSLETRARVTDNPTVRPTGVAS